jgi:hypothetical protein
MTFEIPGKRVQSTVWNRIITRLRGDMTKNALCAKTNFRVQGTSLANYESGAMVPSVAKFVEIIEAAGGVVIVRHGSTEYHVTVEA